MERQPRHDLLSAVGFLDAVDTMVTAAHRQRFEQLRDLVRSADDGHGVPEALLHGALSGNPPQVVPNEHGPIAINWMAAEVRASPGSPI